MIDQPRTLRALVRIFNPPRKRFLASRQGELNHVKKNVTNRADSRPRACLEPGPLPPVTSRRVAWRAAPGLNGRVVQRLALGDLPIRERTRRTGTGSESATPEHAYPVGRRPAPDRTANDVGPSRATCRAGRPLGCVPASWEPARHRGPGHSARMAWSAARSSLPRRRGRPPSGSTDAVGAWTVVSGAWMERRLRTRCARPAACRNWRTG